MALAVAIVATLEGCEPVPCAVGVFVRATVHCDAAPAEKGRVLLRLRL